MRRPQASRSSAALAGLLIAATLMYLGWRAPSNPPGEQYVHTNMERACRFHYAEPAQWCAALGTRPRQRPVRIFEFMIFDTEVDLLEIRLQEHAGVVDRLVVLEAGRTSTGKKKPMYLKHVPELTERFKVRMSARPELCWLAHMCCLQDLLLYLPVEEPGMTIWGTLGLKSKAAETITWSRDQLCG